MGKTRLADLVAVLDGRLAGDPDLEITGIAPLDTAGATEITFLSNPRLRNRLGQSQAAALILTAADHDKIAASAFPGARIIVNNPYAGFAKVAQWFAVRKTVAPLPGTHPSAVVAASAQVDPSAVIGAHVTIDDDAVIGADCIIDSGCHIGRNARVGDGTRLYPRVVLMSDCRIGKRGIVHSGAVIGADGFGFANEDGVWIKIPQMGGVSIGDDVEIGANTTIDRGALTDTVIEDGVKLDNQIQIAHNCHIGAYTAMAACVGVAGSAVIGKYCTIGGAAMINGHITIADRVHVTAGTLVPQSLTEPGAYSGFYPVAKHAEWEKSAVLVRNLGGMREQLRSQRRQLRELERKLDALTGKNSG